ncbi:MAG: tetratricopeptide repeat protein [Elainellaceae cyanobacterium]
MVRQLHLADQSPRVSKFTRLLLRKKVEMLRQISSHQRLSTIVGYFEDEHSFYWVEAFVAGESLRGILTQEALPEAEVIGLMQNVLQGLVTLHGWGVLHGDIKPSKIIRRQADRQFLLTGPGVFKAILEDARPLVRGNSSDAIAQTAALNADTPKAIAPEAANKSGHWFNRDINALGLLAKQALSSPEPQSALFSASTPAVGANINEPAAGPRAAAPSSALAAILERMVCADVEHGYPSAAAALEDLRSLNRRRAAGRTLPSSNRRRWLPKPLPRLWSRPKVLAAVTSAAGLIAIAYGGLPQRFLAHYWLYRASETAEQGKYQQAIALSTRALSLIPSGPAYLQRGMAHRSLEDWKAARSDLTQAIALAPHLGEAFYYRGDVRSALGNYPGALADYTEALKLDMSPEETYLQRGGVRAALGDSQGAIADYTLALEQQPSSATAYAERCLAHSDAGDHLQGLQDCSRAIDLDPSAVTVYQTRGLVRQRLGDVEGAIADLNLALRLDPRNAEIYYIRGRVRLEVRDQAGALQDFTKAINISPSHDLAYYERGMIRKQVGDLAGARRDLEQAVSLCLEHGRRQCYESAQTELAQPPLTQPPQPASQPSPPPKLNSPTLKQSSEV